MKGITLANMIISGKYVVIEEGLAGGFPAGNAQAHTGVSS